MLPGEPSGLLHESRLFYVYPDYLEISRKKGTKKAPTGQNESGPLLEVLLLLRKFYVFRFVMLGQGNVVILVFPSFTYACFILFGFFFKCSAKHKHIT